MEKFLKLQQKISANNKKIKIVTKYNYLEHTITLEKENGSIEITREVKLSSAALGKVTMIMINNTILKGAMLSVSLKDRLSYK